MYWLFGKQKTAGSLDILDPECYMTPERKDKEKCDSEK